MPALSVERERLGAGRPNWAESAAEKRAVGGGAWLAAGPPSATGTTGLLPVCLVSGMSSRTTLQTPTLLLMPCVIASVEGLWEELSNFSTHLLQLHLEGG